MRNIRKGFKSVIIPAIALVLASALITASLGAVTVIAASPVISYWNDADSKLGETPVAAHIKMYDRNGQQFAEVWSSDRDPVQSLNDVSPYMRSAMISAEDKDFYNHGAIDILATARSLLTRSGGGSGITQQLIKNLVYLSYGATDKQKKEATEVTIARKLNEMKMAAEFERTHSKDEILLKYLNTVSIGSANIYGVQTASREIFGKSAKDLTVGEAAALAGSVNNTSRYNMLRMDDKTVADMVKQRQNYVLDRMLDDGKISKSQHDDAVKAPIQTNIQQQGNGCGRSQFPFYCQYVLDHMMSDPQMGSNDEERQLRVNQGGIAVYTALDPTLTRQAEDQVKRDMGVWNRVAMPIAVVQPGTGDVLAIAANREWGVDASQGQTQIPLAESKTQTGSTYKMITLATAVSQGWSEDRLNSVNGYCPWTKPGYDAPPGGISNSISCASQGGRIGYLRATAVSSNTFYVELSTEVGIGKLMDMSRKLGLTVPDTISERSASFTLGVASDSPIQMAAAYATFTNKGVYCPPTPVRSYGMLDGSAFAPADTYDPAQGGCKAVLTPKQASIVLKAQNAVVNGSDPDRLGIGAEVPGHQTVGKSGTTNDLANSAWTSSVGQYSVFANTYDPRGNYAHPLTYYVYRGMGVDGYYHGAMQTTKDIIAANLAGQPNIPLDLGSNDNNYVKVKVDTTGMKTVPDVTGMKAETALKTMEAAGFNAKVLKKTSTDGDISSSVSYRKGSVVSQSLAPGTRLTIGSKRIVELTVIEGA